MYNSVVPYVVTGYISILELFRLINKTVSIAN